MHALVIIGEVVLVYLVIGAIIGIAQYNIWRLGDTSDSRPTHFHVFSEEGIQLFATTLMWGMMIALIIGAFVSEHILKREPRYGTKFLGDTQWRQLPKTKQDRTAIEASVLGLKEGDCVRIAYYTHGARTEPSIHEGYLVRDPWDHGNGLYIENGNKRSLTYHGKADIFLARPVELISRGER